MRRFKKQGGDAPSGDNSKQRAAGAGASSRAEFDYELLYKDAQDKQALESLNEFERERELTRRYEEFVRERQREELLSRQDRRDGRMEALSDIRARRARMKQQQSRTTDSSSSSESEEGEVQEVQSAMDVSEPEEGATEEGHSVSSSVQPSAESVETRPCVLPKKRPPMKQEEAAPNSLFAEERSEHDSKRKKASAEKMLEKISLELLNRLRLSSSVILHILEHPNAEAFLKGCFVKVLSPQTLHGAAPLPSSLGGGLSPDAASQQVLVCQIVGLKELPEEYTVVVDGSTRQCRYTLTLRATPKASAKYDRDFSLKELINAPVTPEEFEVWRKKLKHYDAAEDLSKRMRAKQLQLEKFTFTDEDVREILNRRETRGRLGCAPTRVGLIKESTALRHQVASVMETLSNTSTASQLRQEARECLGVLLERKAFADEQLSKCVFEAPSLLSHHPTNRTPGSTRSPVLLESKLGALAKSIAATAEAERAASSSLSEGGIEGLTSVSGGGADSSAGPRNLLGGALASRETRRQLVESYRNFGEVVDACLPRLQLNPKNPPPQRALLLVPEECEAKPPPQCSVISLEDYKRQVAQLAHVQLSA